MSIEASVAAWLRFERRCKIVLCERTPREWRCGRPDVLGITKDRYTIEVEIKRSVSDFRANARKRISEQYWRDTHAKALPKQFYFAMPSELAAKVLSEVPTWAGMLTNGGRGIISLKPAEINRQSVRLSIKEMCHVAYLQSNQVYSQMQALANFRSYERDREKWFSPEYSI